MLTFWPMITSKVIGSRIYWPDMQILFKFQANRMKFEDFREFGSNWPIGLCDLFGPPNFTKLQCGTVTGSVVLIFERFRVIGWAVRAGGERTDTHTNKHTNKRRRSTCLSIIFFGQVSTTKEVFLKSSIFISSTWNLKRSCTFGHWIQSPIIFEGKFVLLILQVSCSAQCFLLVCLSAQNFRDFLCNRLSDWDEIFTIGATTHVECFNDNYGVIGHVVWQPYWKKRNNFGPLYLWNHTKEKIETWHIWTPYGEWM